MNATPRPWKVRLYPKIESIQVDGPSEAIADLITEEPMDYESAQANAELIVRAVNSYDAMREALEAAQHELKCMLHCIKSEDGCAGNWTDHVPGITDARKRIKSALALAKNQN